MRGPSNATRGALAVTVSVGSLSISYWLVRRFRRRLNQSKTIRSGKPSRANASSLEIGDYVRLRGTVAAGSRKLESPNKRVPCVAYRVVTVRVVDSRTAKKKASVTGIGGLLAGLSRVIPWLLSFTTKAEVDTEKWDTVYQPISMREEMVEIYLEDDSLAHLEAMAAAGTDTRHSRVRLDLAGAEFFSMKRVAEDFTPESGTAGTSRTHLGYRTTEEVLAIGSRVVVLGEVGKDYEGQDGDLVLRKASPFNIFDLKTASISRPFVVSTKTEEGLLQEIERSGRIYFWTALPSVTVGVLFAYLGTVCILAAIEDRSSSRNEPVTVARGRGSASRSPSLLRLMRS